MKAILLGFKHGMILSSTFAPTVIMVMATWTASHLFSVGLALFFFPATITIYKIVERELRKEKQQLLDRFKPPYL